MGRHVYPRTVVSVGKYYKNPTKCVGLVQSRSPLAQALYLTRQHYRKTIASGEDNNRVLYLWISLTAIWAFATTCHSLFIFCILILKNLLSKLHHSCQIWFLGWGDLNLYKISWGLGRPWTMPEGKLSTFWKSSCQKQVTEMLQYFLT